MKDPVRLPVLLISETTLEQTDTEDQALIAKLKEGDEASVVEVYKRYRPAFVQWAQDSYQVDEATGADVFQDAVVCLYRNVVKGKLKNPTSSLKTYLFAIAKNVLDKKLQTQVTLDHDDLWIVENLQAEPVDCVAANDRQRFVAKLMDSIGEPCKSILRYSYFKEFSMEAIAQTMNYKDENVVKTQKLRCLTTLKTWLRERYNSGDFI